MNLFNQKILQQRFSNFDFPTGERANQIVKNIAGWQRALKDSNLAKTKEKSVQGLFLSAFFGDILGYTTQTEGVEEWHLIQHPTSEVDAQEPDGSLGFFTKDGAITKAVIELKDARTSLDKKQTGRERGFTPIEQAYLYATKFDRCNWIIVSNFREIRLYHKNRTQDYVEKFDVLELQKEAEFKRFYYLLCRKNLITRTESSIIDNLANDTTAVSEDITKKFYEEYKSARLKLFLHLIEHNPTIDQTTLLEEAQKIIDRLIFILFCEDTGNLLPGNLVKTTYELGSRSRERNDERVWREFKNLFMDIDVGRSDIDPKINKYNGGLFANDDTLNSLSIKDAIWQSLVALNAYDFESELDVNILGHIFEQSISDLETLKTTIPITTEHQDILTIESGERIVEEQEKLSIVEKMGRRKKEGIFYTPDSITKYITSKTIGSYLEDNPNNLESIKILDPACGSGAFLNQAHTYLMNEYKARQEQKMFEQSDKKQLDFSDINLAATNRSILLNNLFGVDLNQESVEITKLSLWLKTARASEPLQNLDKNIKCGNSIIDAPELDERTFDWHREFQNILEDGGFDVIVGNPPYISSLQLSKIVGVEVKEYWKHNYASAVGTYDIYILFLEQAIRLLKPGGYLGFITPNKYLAAPYGEGIRKYIKENCKIVEVFDLSRVSVFEEPSVYPVMTILKKEHSNIYQIESKKSESITLVDPSTTTLTNDILSVLPNEMFSLIIAKHPKIIAKIFRDAKPLEAYAEINATSTAAESDSFSKHIDDQNARGKKIVNTGTIERYVTLWGITEFNNKRQSILKPYLHTDRINLSEHRELIYNSPKIIVAKVAKKIEAFLDLNSEYVSINTNCIYKPRQGVMLEYLLGVLNSKLMTFIYEECFGALKMSGGYLQFQAPQLTILPIVMANSDQQESMKRSVTALSDKYLKLYSERKNATDILKSRLKLSHITEKLKVIDKLGWNEFVEELEKLGVPLFINETEELSKWFRKKQAQLLKIHSQADDIEEVIDRAVYKLYHLSDNEIQIVMGRNQHANTSETTVKTAA